MTINIIKIAPTKKNSRCLKRNQMLLGAHIVCLTFSLTILTNFFKQIRRMRMMRMSKAAVEANLLMRTLEMMRWNVLRAVNLRMRKQAIVSQSSSPSQTKK